MFQVVINIITSMFSVFYVYCISDIADDDDDDREFAVPQSAFQTKRSITGSGTMVTEAGSSQFYAKVCYDNVFFNIS